MCCIFTCCGWMIDLIQRLWTFTMSCCISSAVCCALITGSMAGIALGYNYSLAEYIDLKETNVSIYLKRGIFDDEIGDDMDWRRSGQPVGSRIVDRENNLRAGLPEEERQPLRSGRRLDDSILESDDRHRFEGSLMKLTATPIVPSATPETESTFDANKILSKFPQGSLEQMKALQTLINMKKMEDPRLLQLKARDQTKIPQISQNEEDELYRPPNANLGPGRKFMAMPPLPNMPSPPPNSARYAVPHPGIGGPGNWKLPKVPPEAFTRDDWLGEPEFRPTYPPPVTPRAGPIRPSRPKPVARPRPTATASPVQFLDKQDPNYPKSVDDIDTFKDQLLSESLPSFKNEDFMKDMKNPKSEEDYGDAVRGIPMRKRRHITSNVFKNIKRNKTSIDNVSTDKQEIPEKRDSVVFEKLKNIKINKTSTHESSMDKPKDPDASNNTLNILQKSLSNILQGVTNRQSFSTSDKIEVTTNPDDAIIKISTSNRYSLTRKITSDYLRRFEA